MEGRSVRTNTSWAFAGNAAQAGCQWIVVVLLLKGLGAAEVGRFAYWIAVTGPIFVLANVRLRNLLAAGAHSPGDFSDYFAARVLTTCGAMAASLLVGAIAAPGTGLDILAFIAAAKACDAVSDICHGCFQRELDMRSAAVGLMANGMFSVVLVGASLVLSPSLAVAMAAYAAGSAAALVIWDLPRLAGRIRRRPGSNLRTMCSASGRLIAKALPLGLSSAVGSVQANLPRYAIGTLLGPAALGVFAALSYIPTLGNLVVNAVAQAALPELARDLRSAPQRYRRRLLVLVTAGATVGAVSLLAAAVFGRQVLSFVYGSEYAQYVSVLLWLIAGAAVSYGFVFMGTGTTARLRFGAQFTLSLAGLSVVALTVHPFVERHGLVGAAWSLLAGAVVEGCGYAALTVRDLTTVQFHRIVPDGLAEGAQS
jgi:O-antigen/teichoic acid export membrane protein